MLREKHRQAFERAAAEVQSGLARLEPLLALPANRESTRALKRSHAELLQAYRAALARYTPADPGATLVADLLVRGMDRPVVEEFQRLVDAVEVHARQTAKELVDDSERAATAARYRVIAAVGAMAAFWILVFAGIRRSLRVVLQRATESEGELRESEARYRQFVDRSPYGVFVHGEGRFRFVNPLAVALLGAQSEAELLGRELLDFVHPESRDELRERIRRNGQARPAPRSSRAGFASTARRSTARRAPFPTSTKAPPARSSCSRTSAPARRPRSSATGSSSSPWTCSASPEPTATSSASIRHSARR